MTADRLQPSKRVCVRCGRLSKGSRQAKRWTWLEGVGFLGPGCYRFASALRAQIYYENLAQRDDAGADVDTNSQQETKKCPDST